MLPTLALLNLLLYAPALDNGFSLDDFNWLERAAFRTSTVGFLLQPEPGQLISPVPKALFLTLYSLAGLEPLAYRLAILSLHVVAAFLVWSLASRLGGDRRVGWLAAVLFSLHTAYDEALFWVAALFHPIATVLALGTLIAFLAFLGIGDDTTARSHDERGGGRGAALACAGLFLAGCLSKASAFVTLVPAALSLLLPGVVGARRRRGLRLLAGLGGLAAAVLAVNLAAGAADSYLIEHGYYRLGLHMVGNLAHYAAWLLLPFAELFARLGLEGVYVGLFGALRWLAPGALLVVLALGTPAVRVAAALAGVALLPFLPFVFDPVSRYTYLPAAGMAIVVALLVVGFVLGEREAGASHHLGTPRSASVCLLLALATLFLASAADTRLRDNHYEHRERQMRGWIADVEAAVGDRPRGVRIGIVGLPRLAIDPGIHFEAALRLHYGDPELGLQVLESAADAPGDAIVLDYRGGRIVPLRVEPFTPRSPDTRE